MNQKLKKFAFLILIFLIIGLIILGINSLGLWGNDENYNVNVTELNEKLSINMSNWNYDEENNVYYQIGLIYCTNPETSDYESLAIYVPGDYFNGEKNSNGIYTCTLNEDNHLGNYSSSDAPIVMPINTAGYSAHIAPTEYNLNEAKDYLDAGYIYVDAGCRGRENGDNYSGGAPWGVTDLKAAVLYLKFNDADLPGDGERIFSFGHSGGGAQSAILGASGDSELYTPYLESIGAALLDKDGNKLSDSICGAMCWCPITSLDYADEAYEWTMGQYSNSGIRSNDSWTKALSDDLALEYANYINELNLKSPEGQTLTLEESDNGIYASGSYYDYMIYVLENSLNNFLNDTSFPYSSTSDSAMGSGGPSGDVDSSDSLPSGDIDSSDSLPSGDINVSDMGSVGGGDSESMPMDAMSNSADSSETYETPQDYIDSLNEDGEWIEYDNSTNTVKITSVEEFVNHCKSASKDLGAFDDLDRSQAENNLFGNDESESLHFDKVLAKLLEENADKYSKYSDYDSSYASEYSSDLSELDKLNKSIEYRSNMYNPMYYLCDYYEGAGSSDVAKYWRINSGIEQTDTSFTVETNLALALEQCSSVDSVDFNAVWGQGHTQAERTGSSTDNFINWVNECLN